MNHPIPCAVERDLAAYDRLQCSLDALDRAVEDESGKLIQSGAFLSMKWLANSDERQIDEAMDKLAHLFAARTDRERAERVWTLKNFFLASDVTEQEALRRVQDRGELLAEEIDE